MAEVDTVETGTGDTLPADTAPRTTGLPAALDVLVVDDDADVRSSVSEILRAAGFGVDEAEDGDAALSLMARRHYGLVLLDLRMPKRDGISVVESDADGPPVVVHSAYLLGGLERLRLGERLVRYLRKPVSPQELVSAVQGAIGAAAAP